MGNEVKFSTLILTLFSSFVKELNPTKRRFLQGFLKKIKKY